MLEVIILTVQIALLATAINLPVSLIIANYQDKLPSKFKFILDVFISLPLALPPVVTGYFSVSYTHLTLPTKRIV